MSQLELLADAGPRAGPEVVTVEGEHVHACSPEGAARSMRLVELLERVVPRRLDTGAAVLPDGVKCALPVPGGTVLVHQTPPRVHRFQWIAPDSPAPFGKGARYREVRLALPYLVVLAVFDGAPGAIPSLARSSECFFSNRPLDLAGLATELRYPALLNCSRFPDEDPARPLSWICVEHLRPLAPADDVATALRQGLASLLHHLLESGFNLSSEHHELSSWYSETVAAAVDPRVATVEAWERASAEDGLFALDVPWLPAGRTLAQVVARIGAARPQGGACVRTARDLQRVLFQDLPRK